MFENNFTNPYNNFNTMPTATQPYGYPLNPFMGNFMNPTQQNTNIPTQTNTNKIYVNGIEDVRNRRLPANSDYIFLDNDNAIIYQKIVDAKGQFEVKAFDISPRNAQESPKGQGVDNSVDYVQKTDLEPLQTEILRLKEQLAELKKGENNGTK